MQHKSKIINNKRADELLNQMTLAEKIGQMTQIEKNSISPEDVAAFGIGSILSGGGGNPPTNSPEAWAAMTRTFQDAALHSRLKIPILYGSDAVHGHSNVKGATIFPHNIGLGATRDQDLVEQIARMTAREIVATNVHWNFAPAVSVPQDIRWGRTYEGYSENPSLVSSLGAAYVRGLHNGPQLTPENKHAVLASVKHFVGDGGTTLGTTSTYDWIPGWWRSQHSDRWKIDQADTQVDEEVLRAVHLPPYAAAIEAGAKNIMISYSSWNGLKLHAHRPLLTELLKGELGFDGFLVSDWLAVSQLNEDFYKGVVQSLNAGLDMIMVPFDYKGFIKAAMEGVENGDIPLSRIDDAVRRILQVKLEMGLFDKPYGDESLLSQVGGIEHRQVAREAVRKSMVLLKNRGGALPLSAAAPALLIAGEGAHDLGLQCGGWTVEWQGGRGAITSGTTLLEAISETVAAETAVHFKADGAFDQQDKADIGLVVLSEEPYAEGEGDRSNLELSAEDVALVARMRPHCEKLIVILYSGRPLLINKIIEMSDAIVAAWLPGSEGQGITDVLFGDYPFTGKLSYTWPRSMAQVPNTKDAADPLFAFGFGLSA